MPLHEELRSEAAHRFDERPEALARVTAGRSLVETVAQEEQGVRLDENDRRVIRMIASDIP